ncbi:RhoGEF domain containing protein [Acanthamoeba castellanii str. Neff]|uniref:RhoGEF domain containing protein n=1 Tax=Acanthamoeba castellanii (strain ATCC 30010 / Neff) TaxID=1257118 RepID=L8GWH6_ACACF|nr:RhoGEF domain containing protein [Acanthamoeba castellanii str. Neff]ELR17569.1 RhoGEF domain containing protein [Acanthamoeba castellanii str. Neff]
MDRPILQPDQMALLIKGLAIDDNPQQQEYCLSILLNLAAEAGNRRHLEALGVAAPIVRILGSDSATDVMRMYACWALSNLTADGPSAAIQEELDAGRLLHALKRIFIEDRDNADVLEKVLWLLTNITTDDYPRNKALVASERYGFMALLTSLLDFATDENHEEGEAIPLSEMEYPEKIVTGAARALLNLFFDAEVQAKFIMQPNAVRQVVSLLSSASRDIQQSVFDLLVNLSAFDAETRKLLVSHQVSVRLTKVLNEAEVFPKILESAIKSTSNIVIEVLALVDMLTRPAIPAVIKNEIATALQSLSTNKDVRDMIFRANAVPPLVDLMIHNLQDSAEAALEDVLRVMVMLTLDEDKQRELRDKHEVDVFFRRIARANELQELHQMALMGLEYLKAPINGPLQPKVEKVATLRRSRATLSSNSSGPISPVPEVEAPVAQVDDERFYMKRKHIAKEILETEKNYVMYLGSIVTRFIEPLESILQKSPKSFITQDDIKKIFSVIRDILAVNGALLVEVEKALEFVNENLKMQLGQAFLSAVDKFKIYSAYVNNFDTSIETLDRVERDPRWRTFKDEVSSSGSVKDLNSLLIMPIQRIPRYLLLLNLGLPKMQELAAWMESEKDKCEGDMSAHTLGLRSRQVLSVMTKLAKQIQGYPKAFMEFGRKPVKEGMVLEYVPATKRSRYRYLFVFTDVIMLTEQKKARRADRAYKFLEDALLVGAQVAALPDTPSLKNAIKLTSSGGTKRDWVFFFGVKLDADLWLSCLSKAIVGANAAFQVQKQVRTSIVLPVGLTDHSTLPHMTMSASSVPIPSYRMSYSDKETGHCAKYYQRADAWPTTSFPQTAEDIENYKKTMIARYEAELLENAARLNIRPRVMSTKEKRMSIKEERKKEKERLKEIKKMQRNSTDPSKPF